MKHTAGWLCAFLIGSVLYTVNTQRAAGRCGTPKVRANVLYRLSRDGSQTKFSCRPHYSLIGNTKASCINGRWHGVSPICIGRGCPGLKPLKHGYVTYKYGGRLMTFSCEKGYLLQGPSVLACNGRNWNGTRPNCTDTQQSRPPRRHSKRSHSHDQYGKTHDDWLLEADYSCINRRHKIPPPHVNKTMKVTKWAVVKGKARLYTVYICKWGYVPDRKHNILYCKNNQWKGSTPICRRFKKDKSDDFLQRDQPVRRSHKDWLRLADYSCLGRRGMMAPQVDNAIRLMRYAILEGLPHLYAQYRCKPGYRLMSADKQFLYCTERRWSGDIPRCIPGVAEAQTAPERSDPYKYSSLAQSNSRTRGSNRNTSPISSKHTVRSFASKTSNADIKNKPRPYDRRRSHHVIRTSHRSVINKPHQYPAITPRPYVRSTARPYVNHKPQLDNSRRTHDRWRDARRVTTRTQSHTQRSRHRPRGVYPRQTSSTREKQNQPNHERSRSYQRTSSVIRHTPSRRRSNPWNYEQATRNKDQCANNNGGCSHICNVVYGQPRCSCRPGYQLERDGKTCRDLRYARKYENNARTHAISQRYGSSDSSNKWMNSATRYAHLDGRRATSVREPWTDRRTANPRPATVVRRVYRMGAQNTLRTSPPIVRRRVWRRQ